MARTASALSTEQSLYIAQDERISGDSSIAILESSVDYELNFSDRPAVFNYGTRSRFHFDLNAEYAQHFGVIRGLIEFNRPKELTFVFHPDTKSFETDIESIHLDHLNTVLPLVNSLLLKEIRFKTTLKDVIRFEEIYRKEKEKVYASFL